MVFIGFSTPRAWNPLSALICAMTRSCASHTWLLVEDPIFKLRLVLEAHSSGFRLVTFTRFVKRNKVVALVKPAHPIEPGLPEAGAWLGEGFDGIGLFGIFLTLLPRWIRQQPRRNPFPTTRAVFCSEAVVRTLRAASYPGSERLGDETTTPAELLAFLREDPANVVYDGASLKLWGHLRAGIRSGAAMATSGPPCATPADPAAARDDAA